MDSLDKLPGPVRGLVRPQLSLRKERTSSTDVVAGVRGGVGVVPLSVGVQGSRTPKHWLSVDCGWLQENGFGLSGCLSVYELSGLDYVAVNDPSANLLRIDGEPLFGRVEPSLPPEGAIEAYVPESEWASLGPEYYETARSHCPIFQDDVAAVLGGWHFEWPDGPPKLPALQELNDLIGRRGGPGAMSFGETYRVEPYRLAVWTLLEAEPWVEVWVGPNSELHAVSRIT